MTGPAILEFREIRKCFPTPSGPVEVLHGVDLSIREGEFVAVTGPSGSGKSTLLNLAALLDSPTSGRVFFDGRDVSGLDEAGLCGIRKREIGMVFQKGCLLPHRSALENVRFRFRYLGCSRSEAESRSERALEIVGLREIAHRPARLLSGGEMGRVGIARAVAADPKLLIADEPTGSLDPSSADAIMECFRKLNRSGVTILMATHNESLLRYCSRHLVCRGGGIRTREP